MDKIELGNVNYEINLTDKLNEKLGEDTYGKIWYNELKMFLDKNLPQDLIIQTFFHELAHAICQETSFNDMLMDNLGDNGYEIFIDNLGKRLYDIIYKNDVKEIISHFSTPYKNKPSSK